MTGSYVLLIQLPEAQSINVGSLKTTAFPHGNYAYVGSAMGGFKSRLNRHLKSDKKPRWHIDYLLNRAFISGIILIKAEERLECAIAQALNRQFMSVPGFGCSDCRCRSHLFLAPEEMEPAILATLNRLNIKPESVRVRSRHDGNYTGKAWGNGVECAGGI